MQAALVRNKRALTSVEHGSQPQAAPVNGSSLLACGSARMPLRGDPGSPRLPSPGPAPPAAMLGLLSSCTGTKLVMHACIMP